jgi:hypothetical protein
MDMLWDDVDDSGGASPKGVAVALDALNSLKCMCIVSVNVATEDTGVLDVGVGGRSTPSFNKSMAGAVSSRHIRKKLPKLSYMLLVLLCSILKLMQLRAPMLLTLDARLQCSLLV